MATPHVTRSLGPIHFEDLDPHRFEDLVRQLAYEFRQWQSIESTGRGGGDDGFDIRAYEVARSILEPTEDEDREADAPHPMEGNLWMMQCKREKALGPKRVVDIIKDSVISESPPYGYILAAPANFSKTAHDRFREELRQRGVMEFYLWGAGELEDMLYLPKNDHILFAYFGISLVSRRRSRVTEVRAAVGAKNKLMRVLGEHPQHKSLLLRDLKDSFYPYEEDCPDFARQPRWKSYEAIEFHPLGLVVAVGQYYAFRDKKKATWDFTDVVNVVRTGGEEARQERKQNEELALRVKGFWEMLPRSNQAMLVKNGLVRFDAIALVDDRGDSENDYPHIFVDFHPVRGPFHGLFEYLKVGERQVSHLDELTRITIFPEAFESPRFGTVYNDKYVELDDRMRSFLKHDHSGPVNLYAIDDRYAFLKPTDVIGVAQSGGTNGEGVLLKVTCVRDVLGRDILSQYERNPMLKVHVQAQVGRELVPEDCLKVIEALQIYNWQLAQSRPVI